MSDNLGKVRTKNPINPTLIKIAKEIKYNSRVKKTKLIDTCEEGYKLDPKKMSCIREEVIVATKKK